MIANPLNFMVNVFVVIPAMNEEKSIGLVVSELVKNNYKVIVVNDASTDLTAEKARAHGATILNNVKNLGAWKSTQAGMRYAYKHGADVVITMDADGQHHVSEVEKLLAAHLDGADVVIGNCVSRGSTGRHIAWRVFKKLNRLPVNDITSGFRLYNKEALYALVSRQATMLEYQCVGILIMLRNMKLTIKEVPVKMDERKDGISRIFYSWNAVFYYLAYSGLLTVSKAFPVKKESYINKIQH